MKHSFIWATSALLLALSLTACVDDAIYSPASFASIENTLALSATQPVIVTAVITSLSGVERAVLYYSVDGGALQSVVMNYSGDLFTATIPAQTQGATVAYFIEAVSIRSDVTVSVTLTYTVGAEVVDYTGLRLNELNGVTKFIELYNGAAKSIYIKGIYIQKDGVVNWTCSVDSLRANSFLLLYSVDVTGSGGAEEGYDSSLVFDSGLSAKKNVRVQLFTPAAVSIDDFNLVAIEREATNSYSRNNNLTWAYSQPTPGAANVESSDYVGGLDN